MTQRYDKPLTRMITAIMVVLLLAACTTANEQSGKPQVVATTSILGDVVAQVAGEHVEVRVLLPVDSDPHSFQPAPQDMAAIEQAAVVFINGFGLEASLGDLIADSAAQGKIVEVSQGVAPLFFGESAAEHAAHEDEHDHAGVDPHVWMSPRNVIVWVDSISAALSELDPGHASDFEENARAYQKELEALDEWAAEQFVEIPENRRLLVSDHETFNYLADAYGLEVVGALTGFSSMAEASAQDLAALEDSIRALDVPAIFVSTTVPPRLADRVAEDTGVQVVRVYTGSLSGADGPAASYLQMMRTTVTLMAAALKR